ncbi:MAG: aminotransferase class I/II-fold pyridoxal phosphate-dependent enzyme [Caldilineales bacterium]|nr:aminotransferase class I/II-fold pyridoxal phosphate-dependent enzyme [Caldilineales bacterium]
MNANSHFSAARIRGFGTTIFAEYTALAEEHGAVNLGQGFPNFPAPDFVKEAARDAVAADQNQYTRYGGHSALVQALAAQAEIDLGRSIDPWTEIQITSGATASLFAACQAFLDPGDEVILFEPFYDAYPVDVTMAGGVPRFVPLHPQADGDWRYDPDELRTAFSPRTKLVFLNTPHNPTGKVFTRPELEEIAGLCQAYDALVVADEVYERMIFDGRTMGRIATIPGMWERTISIGSAGKSFSVTGWKIGWSIGPSPLIAAIRSVSQWMVFSVATPLQAAVAQAVSLAPSAGYYEELASMYQAKRDRMGEILDAANLKPLTPDATYFTIADTSAYHFTDDDAFCRWLTAKIGVNAIPPSAFYSSAHKGLARHLARFCFCKTDETLDAAAERLQQLSRAGG